MGLPVFTLIIEEEKPPVKKRKRHKKKENNEAVAESRADMPIVIEGKHGSVIYQIQNINVYFTADVVQQLNQNPEKVVNIIQDQVQAQFEKLAKADFKPENEVLEPLNKTTES